MQTVQVINGIPTIITFIAFALFVAYHVWRYFYLNVFDTKMMVVRRRRYWWTPKQSWRVDIKFLYANNSDWSGARHEMIFAKNRTQAVAQFLKRATTGQYANYDGWEKLEISVTENV